MGNWYSTPYKDSLIKAVEELYDLELPDAIALLIVWQQLNGLEYPDQEFLDFSEDGIESKKNYSLNIKVLRHSKEEWSSGMGLLFRHPPAYQHGTWILEMKIVTRDYGMGIGVLDLTKIVEGNFSFEKDVEYVDGWCGYYHGGASVNVCVNGSRKYKSIFKDGDSKKDTHFWSSGETVGVYVDFDQRTLAPVHQVSNPQIKEEKESPKSHTIDKKSPNLLSSEQDVLTEYEVALPEKNIPLGWSVWFHKVHDSVVIYPPRKIR